MKIISGGQTGVDRAALDFALDFNFEVGGYCPKGRKAEDGTLSEKYSFLIEMKTGSYADRTIENVRQADATLLITDEVRLSGGSRLTHIASTTINKPIYIMHPRSLNKDKFVNWLDKNNVQVLNIAGPRESKRPGIYALTYAILCILFRR